MGEPLPDDPAADLLKKANGTMRVMLSPFVPGEIFYRETVVLAAINAGMGIKVDGTKINMSTGFFHKLISEISGWENEARRLQHALTRHGRHDDDCPQHPNRIRATMDVRPCACGFNASAVLKEVPGA